MKICKQCGLELDDSQFRPTKSRSAGKHKSKTGSSTICRCCESLNVRAHNALRDNNQEAIATLRDHYKRLYALGYPPVTAAARRILGEEVQTRSTNELLSRTMQYDAEVLEHAYKVRTRSYSSFDEADAVHRQLTDQLKEADLYEEINNLMDDWYMDED